MLKDKGNIQFLKVDRRFITLFKPFFRGEEIKSSEMRIFFEILVRIGSFQPQSRNCIALSSSELVCGLPHLNQMIGLHDASWIRRLTQQANLTWFR